MCWQSCGVLVPFLTVPKAGWWEVEYEAMVIPASFGCAFVQVQLCIQLCNGGQWTALRVFTPFWYFIWTGGAIVLHQILVYPSNVRWAAHALLAVYVIAAGFVPHYSPRHYN